MPSCPTLNLSYWKSPHYAGTPAELCPPLVRTHSQQLWGPAEPRWDPRVRVDRGGSGGFVPPAHVPVLLPQPGFGRTKKPLHLWQSGSALSPLHLVPSAFGRNLLWGEAFPFPCWGWSPLESICLTPLRKVMLQHAGGPPLA